MKKIDVIVTVFNASKTLNKCLLSLVNQTFTDYRVIIINDGSTDSSADICKKFIDYYSNTKYFYQNNLGVSSARNKGLELADAQFVMFVDSDDYLELNALELMYQAYLNSNIVTVLCGMQRTFYRDNKKTYAYNILPNCKEIKNANDFKKNYGALYLNSLINSPCCKLYSYSIIQEHCLRFDVNIDYGEDLLFNLSYFFFTQKISIVNIPLYHYQCINTKSLTSKFSLMKLEHSQKIYDISMDFSKRLNMLEAVPYIALSYVKNCFINMENILIYCSGKEKKELLEKIISTPQLKEARKNLPLNRGDSVLYYIVLKTEKIWIIKKLASLRYRVKRVIRG